MTARTACWLGIAALLLSTATSCSDNQGPSQEGITLQGTGATFPQPLYQRWFAEYNKMHPEVKINYQGLGSGAGVKQVIDGLVNFGASDAAMNDEEMAKVSVGVQLLPMTAGSIVLAYNLPDAPQPLKLSREAYAKIFLGKITKWNDPLIVKANGGAKLPDMPITVTHRSDGSGTTFVFTKHLSAISPEWESGPKFGKSVNWPVGVGAKGNPGVAALIQQTPGAIGYIEYGYVAEAKLPMAWLENKEGKFVTATMPSQQAALASVELPANLIAWVSDPDGAAAYPIVTYTWIICYKKYDQPQTAETLKKVFKYCLTDGQKLSAELGYIPLPENVTAKVIAALDTLK